MRYFEFLTLLKTHIDENFADFQRKLIFTKQEILGIRTPILRKLAKQFKEQIIDIFAYPDDVYEVTFIKLAIVSMLPYEDFIKYLPLCVEKMDNWATCDMFKAKCISHHKEEFLPILQQIFAHGGEYFERYALVTLLSEYIDEPYYSTIENCLQNADMEKYYVHMAAAWLTAEILIKRYGYGLSLLDKNILPTKTHNKAIQKARESFRLTKEQKDYLKSLKK